MDSTDSYAGMFLYAVRAAYASRSGQLAKLQPLAPAVGSAVRAIEATQDKDGLTWAKPTWHVKYLMDQAEAFAGLQAGASLATTLADQTLATRASGDATRMQTAVAALWNTVTLAYDWAVHDTGARVANQWTVLYSDAMQQAWSVAFGVAEVARSAALINSFAASQPNWALPAATALYDNGSTQPVGYWPVAGLGFRGVGLTDVASRAAESIRSAGVAANRAWPFTTGTAGQLILLESYTVSTWATATTTTVTVAGRRTPTTVRKTRVVKATTTLPATTVKAIPPTTKGTTPPTTTTTMLLPLPAVPTSRLLP
jgi:hypothetical protein